jgi:hypothetical protein
MTKSALSEKLKAYSPEQIGAAIAIAILKTNDIWSPIKGSPQEEAMRSEADEIFYGGAAGGGKSDFLLGLGLTEHKNSIIFRREYPQLAGLVLRSKELLEGTTAVYNSMDKVWRDIPGGRRLEFGAVQYEKDKRKYQGRPHDLKGFDELTNFTKSQYIFLTGWARTAIPGQRVRIVATGNPPTEESGMWVIERWGPWLDPEHPDYPETPGKLRWYATVDGEEKEFENGEEFSHMGERGEEVITPRSRTFFPASIEDNPYYMETGYKSVLQSLPEPLRSQLLYGDFSVGVEADPWQVIPTAWVKMAMERGKQRPVPDTELSQLGVDVARSGNDKTVYAPRHGNWYGPLERHEKQDTMTTAEQVKQRIWLHGVAVIDLLNMGAGVYDRCRQWAPIRNRVRYFNASEAAKSGTNRMKDRSGKLTFVNMRAWAYWNLREALDPDNGDDISLPNDKQLLEDLTAPRWLMRSNGIQIEAKEDIKARIGRSPDDGDAVVMATVNVIPMGLPDDQPTTNSKWIESSLVDGESKFRGRY